jgi:Cu(I)/Ag(I) efflux system membrane protein CusA/SilA
MLMTVPEVERVFGKMGRRETATDPAPLEMVETTIRFKPREQWRAGMTMEKLIEEMDRALQIPGLANVWVPPIRNRIDMLATGIKSPVGVKVAAPIRRSSTGSRRRRAVGRRRAGRHFGIWLSGSRRAIHRESTSIATRPAATA